MTQLPKIEPWKYFVAIWSSANQSPWLLQPVVTTILSTMVTVIPFSLFNFTSYLYILKVNPSYK